MLESKSSQFTFSPEGQILWQEKLNNPLPGIAVALLAKGSDPLKPVINLIENEQTLKHDKTTLKNSLNLWMNSYFSEVLEPLMLLEVPKGMAVKEDAVSKIAAKIYDGLGIVMRADIENLIASLTPETRADLRAKKIRLGPVMAFMPALNKPAAVRLKAMLWSIFNERTLPANVPPDGVVSVKIEGDISGDEEYYRSIGYPLYGARAVRIDMLDRVINCVYDNAKNGKFQARHEMAEWLGCSIDDLYKVLEAMGHKKIHDPADDIVEEVKQEQEDNPKNIKPELASFSLKKGKISSNITSNGEKPKSFKDKNNKDFKKKKDKDKKPKKPSSSFRVMSADAKVNAGDSPFAILQQLKK